MKRTLLVPSMFVGLSMLLVITGGCYFLPYFLARWSQSCTEQEAIEFLRHEIISFKSLNFSPSSELMAMLSSYEGELKKVHAERDAYWMLAEINFQDTKKRNDLITVTRKMLQNYVKDLEEYTKRGVSTTSSVVQFSYDKVVRLTIAVAELEKNKTSLPADEYVKRIDRMHEIVRQSIIYSKKMLRSHLQAGLKEENQKVQTERENITRKMEHVIALNKILYL